MIHTDLAVYIIVGHQYKITVGKDGTHAVKIRKGSIQAVAYGVNAMPVSPPPPCNPPCSLLPAQPPLALPRLFN